MAHANPIGGSTVYIDDSGNDSGNAAIPEDTFTADGWPTGVRFTGPGDTYGSGVVLDIDGDT